MARKMLEGNDEDKLIIVFDGFCNYEEFEEVRRTLKEEIRMEIINISYQGWGDSAEGTTFLNEIELKWKFSNWDSIQIEYLKPKDEASREEVRQWAKLIYSNLIKKFGE